MWTVNPEKTRERYEKLAAYYQDKGLNADDFHCRFFESCKGSQKKQQIRKQYAGGTAGLCPFYDIAYEGVSMRTVVIGKETGYMKYTEFGTSPNFAENSRNILNCVNWKRKNNHIKGTLWTLQDLFQVDTEYIYASYALLDLLRCSFQDESKLDHVSAVNDTVTMRNHCMPYLFDELDILEPDFIICQGEWAVRGKEPFVRKLAQHYGVEAECLRLNANGKYGLYRLGNRYVITCHHPAILGNWMANLAPDSVWPSLDLLREMGVLPHIDREQATRQYEDLVKEEVDRLLEGMESNDRLRG